MKDLEELYADRARTLAEHNPPRYVWIDDNGTHFRCITNYPNPDCIGCRETAEVPADALRYLPPS